MIKKFYLHQASKSFKPLKQRIKREKLVCDWSVWSRLFVVLYEIAMIEENEEVAQLELGMEAAGSNLFKIYNKRRNIICLFSSGQYI